jgi:hypothetical protein
MSLDLPLTLRKPWLLNSIASILPRCVNMILKTGSPSPMEVKPFNLSFLDQNVVRVYTQTLSIFPVSFVTWRPAHYSNKSIKFPDTNQAEAAIKSLTDGLHLTLQRFPFLAGTLSLADRESGKLALNYPSEITSAHLAELMRSKVIPLDKHSFPYTYEQLQRGGMPSRAFHAKMFVPDDFVDFPGIPEFGEGLVDFTKSDAPAMRLQACFIPGGLVLSMYIHHSVMDCSGVTAFWTAFSANVSKVAGTRELEEDEHFGMIHSIPLLSSNLTYIAAVSVAEQQSLLRAKLEARVPMPSRLASAPKADCYCDGIHKYEQTLPADTSCAQRLLVIPAARVRDYRDRMRCHFPADNPPTMCNVLAALVWTHVTRARGARLLCQGQTSTSIGIATDLRKRQQPPETAEYTGNMALFSKGALQVADLMIEDR